MEGRRAGSAKREREGLWVVLRRWVGGGGAVRGLGYFFFQAEDGIRDLTVTGVQTCALPIFGQVASQTLENMTNIAEATTMEVLRPLVGMDKDEITAEARRIGTFPISIIPDQEDRKSVV